MAPDLPTAISVEKFYTDKRGSIVDPNIEAANQRATRDLRNALIKIDQMSDRKDPERCVASWLSSWSAQRVLTGPPANREAMYTIIDYAAAYGILYLKVYDQVPASRRAEIEPWLERLATVGMNTFRGTAPSEHNNLYYWSALAPAVVWLSTQKREFGDYAITVFNGISTQVSPEGFLPLELARGQRALTYHAYALEALVPLWRILRAGGAAIDPSAEDALRRLAAQALRQACNPTEVAGLAGASQEAVVPQQFAWRLLVTPPLAGECSLDATKRFRDFLGGDVERLNDALLRWSTR